MLREHRLYLPRHVTKAEDVVIIFKETKRNSRSLVYKGQRDVIVEIIDAYEGLKRSIEE